MTSTPIRISGPLLARVRDARPDMAPPEAVRWVLDVGIAALTERARLVEPFPAPQSHQDAPEPSDVSGHGEGRQSGLAGLSLAVEGRE